MPIYVRAKNCSAGSDTGSSVSNAECGVKTKGRMSSLFLLRIPHSEPRVHGSIDSGRETQ